MAFEYQLQSFQRFDISSPGACGKNSRFYFVYSPLHNTTLFFDSISVRGPPFAGVERDGRARGATAPLSETFSAPSKEIFSYCRSKVGELHSKLNLF